MASNTVALNSANVNCIPVVTDEGMLILIPEAIYQHAQSRGIDRLVVRLPGQAAETVATKDAIVQLMTDIPRLGYQAAAQRIRRAVADGRLRALGRGRIERQSFDAFRLALRDAELDREDDVV